MKNRTTKVESKQSSQHSNNAVLDARLRKGTTKCPICKQQLHFEIMGTMRIVRDGVYSAYCPTDARYFDVVANGG